MAASSSSSTPKKPVENVKYKLADILKSASSLPPREIKNPVSMNSPLNVRRI